MKNSAGMIALLLLLLHCPAGAQVPTAAQQTSATPWPGLRLRDALEALRIVREARVISHGEPGGSLKPTFLRSDREIRMRYLHGDETMWFALELRGTDIDPREWWIEWAGELVNLAALVSYGEEFDPKTQAPVWKKSIF